MRLFVDGLTTIDSSYLCAERAVVGESWIVDVELAGELNAQGMVFDFADVKKTLKRLIDDTFDHKLIVPEQALAVDQSGAVEVRASTAKGEVRMRAPAQAVVAVPAPAVTGEVIAGQLRSLAEAILPINVVRARFTLRTEQISGPYYHYSHGLKKHLGNCQRIAHGHRSKIYIELNGHYSEAACQYWAKRWQDIYLGQQEDVVALETLSFAEEIDPACHIAYAYDAEQGRFELIVPRDCCELIACETTAENIAVYIAHEINLKYPSDKILVRAYEGVGKGAIAEL